MGSLRIAGLSFVLAALLVVALSVVAPIHPGTAAEKAPADRPSAGMANTPAPAPALAEPVAKPRDRAAEAADLARARLVLARLQKQYRYLDGLTLRVDPTPDDRQAVAYYTTGEIVISPDHVATIDKILAHEVWHIIDWRDNGRLDWGEDLPPSNASAYRSKY